MSDDTTHTDEVAAEPHTNEVDIEESTAPASSAEGSDGSTDTALDYDALLGRAGVKDPHNKRDGLSRKEKALSKSGQEDDADDLLVLQDQIAKLNDRLSKQEAMEMRSKAESSFTKALEQADVDAAEFNSKYKEAYMEELGDFLDAGLSPEKAAQKALKVVLPSVKADRAEKRAVGRARASIPPQGRSPEQTVYKHSAVLKLHKTNPAEYKRIMNARDKGTISVIE